MIWYLWYILGYSETETETPDVIIKKEKQTDTTITKEIRYANVVAELKAKLIPKDY